MNNSGFGIGMNPGMQPGPSPVMQPGPNSGMQPMFPVNNPGFQQNLGRAMPGLQQGPPGNNPGLQPGPGRGTNNAGLQGVNNGGTPGFNPGLQQVYPGVNPGLQQGIGRAMPGVFPPASESPPGFGRGVQNFPGNPQGLGRGAPNQGPPFVQNPMGGPVPAMNPPQAYGRGAPSPGPPFVQNPMGGPGPAMNPPQAYNLPMGRGQNIPQNYANPQAMPNPQFNLYTPPPLNPIHQQGPHLIPNHAQVPVPMNPPVQGPPVNMNMKWGFVGNDGKIQEYTPTVCNLIEQYYSSNAGNVAIKTDNGKEYVIDFQKMNQKACQGKGAVRVVRRLDGNSAPMLEMNDIVWHWKDDDGKFKPYTAEACRQIEHCYRTGQSPVILQGDNTKGYYIDITDMMQVNELSGFKRPIKRQ